ncbi:MAG TPA: nitrilase-related carbon-nitrogen hydrolase [Ilumatobacter sp.]|nr:nitrilase-related carbon-nitrogen hydrolase [Ilumatobacter sp.]
MTTPITHYEAAALQTRATAVSLHDAEQRDRDVRANLTRAFDLIDYVTAFGNSEVKLVVMPEYGINARWQKLSVDEWISICSTVPGPYTDLISAKAQQLKIFIAANMMEVHPDFPGRFFNTSFLVGPTGDILIKHWKNNNNAWVFPYTTPSDIYTEFVERYGRENLFPVAKTEIGNIGLLTCGELGFPENARCTMMNGAEILCHLTSEPTNLSHGDVRNWESLRTARAYENKCYLVMANIGLYENTTRGLHGSHGDSAIHNFDGTVLNKVVGPGETTIKGPIDLEALRRVRAKPFHPVTLRAEMYAKEYETYVGWPNDGFADEPIESIEQTRAMFRDLVERRRELGIDIAARS